MKRYKMSDEQADKMAHAFAQDMHFANHRTDYDNWINEYMDVYNKVRAAIDR